MVVPPRTEGLAPADIAPELRCLARVTAACYVTEPGALADVLAALGLGDEPGRLRLADLEDRPDRDPNYRVRRAARGRAAEVRRAAARRELTALGWPRQRITAALNELETQRA